MWQGQGPPRAILVIGGGYLLFGVLWILLSDAIVQWLAPDPETVTRWQTGKGIAFVALSTAILMALVAYEGRRSRSLSNYWHTLIDHAQEGFWLIDAEGRTVEVNRAMAAMLDCEPDEVIGAHPASFTDDEGQRVFREHIGDKGIPGRRHREPGPRRYELTLISRRGRRVPVLIHATGLRDYRGWLTGSYGFVTDLTSIREQERELRLSRHALAHSFDAIFQTNAAGQIIDANQTACTTLGYSEAELTTLHVSDVDPNFPPSAWPAHWQRLTECGHLRFESEHRRKDGTLVPVEVGLTHLRYDDREYAFAAARDITERRAAEAETERINRALHSLSRANSALVHAQNESDLLEDVCRALTEVGGYPVAWVGWAEQDEARTVRPVAVTGSARDYVRELQVTWDDSDTGQGPSGTAIRTGHSQVSRDITADWTYAPWRQRALRHGLASSAAIPIHGDAGVLGSLNVYSATAGAFDPAEITLLEELATDIAYGIQALRLRAEHQRQLAELRLAQTVFDHSAEGIVVTDPQQRIVAVNRAFTRITGYSEEEVRGRTPTLLHSGAQDDAFYRRMWDELHNNGVWQGEIWNRRKNGEPYPEWLTISEVRDEAGALVNYIAVFADITEAHQTREELAFRTYYDHLTELPNRALFHERLGHALSVTDRRQERLAVLLLDLEGFGAINDGLGAEAGDEVLRQAARRLQDAVAAGDTVARSGGDEFLILLENLDRSRDTAGVITAVLDGLREPMTVADQVLRLSASVGVAVAPTDGEDTDTLLARAATALHRAKQEGGRRVRYFQAELQASVQRRVQLEEALKVAVDQQQLELWYQPQVTLGDGQIFGAEALVRWRHPEWGVLSPAEFIPLAEETGLIVPLGDWVLDEAVRQCAEWIEAGYPVSRVSVNVAPAQLQAAGFPGQVMATLARHALNPERLELEITEQGFLADIEHARENLARLADAGTRLAIDDFGTGYSSLAYLKQLPVNTLKIDKTFIDGLPDDDNDRSIVSAIIAVARALDLAILPEGVETAEQAEWLAENGITQAQGFYYGRPQPPGELAGRLSV
ncbi:sensor domain-containing protein [Arhodomonas sp. SL1]|uniref:sensor domain-containing protein n=1 Tax=Arhodomonas sp. SL1 TaxID=3425691 RepID=UPI003F882880